MYSLFVQLCTAFAEFAVQQFGEAGQQLVAGGSSRVPSLQTFWSRTSETPAAGAARATAWEEFSRDLASEASKSAAGHSSDSDNIAACLAGVALNAFRTGLPVAHDSGDDEEDIEDGGTDAVDDTNPLSLLPKGKATTGPLTFTSSTQAQLINLALRRCDDCKVRGQTLRDRFCAAAKAEPASVQTFRLIPGDEKLNKIVEIPRNEHDVIDVATFGVPPKLSVAQLVAFFLVKTRILESPGAVALQQMGRSALVVPPETVAFARDQANARLHAIPAHHVLPHITTVAPSTLFPGPAAAFLMKQEMGTRYVQQQCAQTLAEAVLLDHALVAVVLLGLRPCDLYAAAKVRASWTTLLFSSAQHVVEWRESVPDLQARVSAAKRKLLGLKPANGDGWNRADAMVVLPNVRNMILQLLEQAQTALQSAAPAVDASPAAVAAYAANQLAVKTFLANITSRANRRLSAQTPPAPAVSVAYFSAVRLLELVHATQGYHVVANAGHRYLPEDSPDRLLFEHVVLNDIRLSHGKRQWLFGKFLPRKTLASCFADGWQPIGFRYNGDSIHVVVQRPAPPPLAPVAPAGYEFLGVELRRDNIDCIGSVVQEYFGTTDWKRVPNWAQVRAGDIILSLLFRRDVTGDVGFRVQQKNLIPLLDFLQNSAAADNKVSFDWLVQSLRDSDIRFDCGVDPGTWFFL